MTYDTMWLDAIHTVELATRGVLGVYMGSCIVAPARICFAYCCHGQTIEHDSNSNFINHRNPLIIVPRSEPRSPASSYITPGEVCSA